MTAYRRSPLSNRAKHTSSHVTAMKINTSRMLAWCLIVELPLILVTLGLMAWTLRILGQSLSMAKETVNGGSSYVFPDTFSTATVTQTVTGYETTTVVPESTITSTSTVHYIDQSSSLISYTYPVTYVSDPISIGIDPTCTKTRTVTVSALAPLSHLVLPKGGDEDGGATPPPLVTPAPFPSFSFRARQASESSGVGATLYDSALWSLPTTRPAYWDHQSVTVNHGFGGHFFEGGLQYDYGTQPGQGRGGYGHVELARIRALTALASLALVALVARMVTTAFFFVRHRTLLRERSNEADKSVFRVIRQLAWVTLSFAVLLLFTYVPFWALYGAWTNRNATVRQADDALQADEASARLHIEQLLHASPWTGCPIALIVFWTLSLLSSLFLAALCLASSSRKH